MRVQFTQEYTLYSAGVGMFGVSRSRVLVKRVDNRISGNCPYSREF